MTMHVLLTEHAQVVTNWQSKRTYSNQMCTQKAQKISELSFNKTIASQNAQYIEDN